MASHDWELKGGAGSNLQNTVRTYIRELSLPSQNGGTVANTSFFVTLSPDVTSLR